MRKREQERHCVVYVVTAEGLVQKGPFINISLFILTRVDSSNAGGCTGVYRMIRYIPDHKN